MTSPIVLATQGEIARYLIDRLVHIEETIMATAAETQQALTALSAAVADYTSDVTAALQQLRDAQAAMQTTINDLRADDAADAAMIADLQSRLNEMLGVTDTVVARASTLTAAIAAADVDVDQPAEPTA